MAILSRCLDQRQSYSMGQCFSAGGEGRGRRGLRTTARAAAGANGEPMKVMIAGAPGTWWYTIVAVVYWYTIVVVVYYLAIPAHNTTKTTTIRIL